MSCQSWILQNPYAVDLWCVIMFVAHHHLGGAHPVNELFFFLITHIDIKLAYFRCDTPWPMVHRSMWFWGGQIMTNRQNSPPRHRAQPQYLKDSSPGTRMGKPRIWKQKRPLFFLIFLGKPLYIYVNLPKGNRTWDNPSNISNLSMAGRNTPRT